MKRRGRRRIGGEENRVGLFFISHTCDQNNRRKIKVSNSNWREKSFLLSFVLFEKKKCSAALSVDWRRNRVIKVGNYSWGILQEKSICYLERETPSEAVELKIGASNRVGGVRGSGPIRIHGLTQATSYAPARVN